MKKLICTLWLLFLPIVSFASDSGQFKKNVIYITLDGVRWQDVFHDHSHFKQFWEKHAQHAKLYGAPDSHTTMQVASIPISLPSYQSQTAGTVQPCPGNECGRIAIETFPEKIKQQLHLQKKEIAIFGSWYSIAEAAEHIEGTVVTNTGSFPMSDPETGIPDPVMTEINNQQLIDFPEDSYTRYDKYTVAQALHYLKKYQPRLLWIALNDSDEYAHADDLKGYHATLAYYDNFLDQLIRQLQILHLDKQTMIIITTDHGRNDNWTGHGDPESKQTWAFVMNGELFPTSESNGNVEYSTLSIRPTIESAMLADKQ